MQQQPSTQTVSLLTPECIIYASQLIDKGWIVTSSAGTHVELVNPIEMHSSNITELRVP